MFGCRNFWRISASRMNRSLALLLCPTASPVMTFTAAARPVRSSTAR